MHRCRSAYPGTPVWVGTAPAAYYGPSTFVRPAGQHTSPTTPVNENRPPLPPSPAPATHCPMTPAEQLALALDPTLIQNRIGYVANSFVRQFATSPFGLAQACL